LKRKGEKLIEIRILLKPAQHRVAKEEDERGPLEVRIWKRKRKHWEDPL